MSDPTNADLVAWNRKCADDGALGVHAQKMHAATASALEQAGKELAEAWVLLSTRVEAERLGEAQRLASSRSTEIARLAATIEAVKVEVESWYPYQTRDIGGAFVEGVRDEVLEILSRSTPTTDAVKRAQVVTLCGSTKFKDDINAENSRLTMEGNVVISLGMFGHTDLPDYDWSTDGSNLKIMLDLLHFQKIRMADSVHVVNPGGYIGESTRREIAYAESLGRPITYMTDSTTDAVKHGPDWSDWQEGDDGDRCLCGFNGTSQECAASRATDAVKLDPENAGNRVPCVRCEGVMVASEHMGFIGLYCKTCGLFLDCKPELEALAEVRKYLEAERWDDPGFDPVGFIDSRIRAAKLPEKGEN